MSSPTQIHYKQSIYSSSENAFNKLEPESPLTEAEIDFRQYVFDLQGQDTNGQRGSATLCL
jgi:hypothetical protein